MIVFMKASSTRDDLQRVVGFVEGLGCVAQTLAHGERAVLRVSGDEGLPAAAALLGLAGVESVLPVHHAPQRSLRAPGRGETIVRVGTHSIGGGSFTIVAGPCAVEGEAQLLAAARAARAAGADLLRGGAYKPRTSPYEFQGLGPAGLELLARARDATGMPIVTEAVDERSIELVERLGDVIQIGARNMQNFALLKRAGASRLPVLLKRGMSATLDELLMAAEYVMDAGNPQVILCERGIRTFSTHSRFTLDLAIVPVLKRSSHLPVFVDPSHASGHAASVAPLARAALAAGADGVIVEVHPDPRHALCDGPQSLGPQEFAALAASLRELATLIGRGAGSVESPAAGGRS
jgi:3-deoxy-7-phosphoheptulonate synthase